MKPPPEDALKGISLKPFRPIEVMKLISVVALVCFESAMMAQEPAGSFLKDAPANSSFLLAQASVPSSNSPSPSASPAPLPSNGAGQGQSEAPPLPSVEELDAMFKQTPLGKAADEARLHAQWRELSNRTVNDPDLVAARRHAEAATTDLEKRRRLRSYYTVYFDRMRARSSSQELRDFIDARKTEHLALLAQDRVRPGSTPARTPGASTSPKGKHKKSHSALEPALPQ